MSYSEIMAFEEMYFWKLYKNFIEKVRKENKAIAKGNKVRAPRGRKRR